MEKYSIEKVFFLHETFMREEMNTDLKSEWNTIPTKAFFLISFVTIHIVTFIA